MVVAFLIWPSLECWVCLCWWRLLCLHLSQALIKEFLAKSGCLLFSHALIKASPFSHAMPFSHRPGGPRLPQGRALARVLPLLTQAQPGMVHLFTAFWHIVVHLVLAGGQSRIPGSPAGGKLRDVAWEIGAAILRVLSLLVPVELLVVGESLLADARALVAWPVPQHKVGQAVKERLAQPRHTHYQVRPVISFGLTMVVTLA